METKVSMPSWYQEHMEDRIWLKVNVREASFLISCDQGSQDFMWLGKVAARKYAKLHLEASPEQYHPVHIMSHATEAPLFPFSHISEECNAGDEVDVELIGPKIGLNDPMFLRQKSLWELYAYTPPQDYVMVRFTFDASDYEPLEEDTYPGIFGNFNNWGMPIPMKKDHGSIYMHQMSFPADAIICFCFCVGEDVIVSENYAIVDDEHDNEMNLFHVPFPSHNYNDLQVAEIITMEKTPDEIAEQEDDANKPILKRITGQFRAVPQLTEAMKEEQFQYDWKKIQIADVIRQQSDRLKCKDVLWKFSDTLRKIFRYYSSQTGKDIAYMNSLQFINFAHICRIPDRRVTVTTLDAVFHRVNIEEEFDEEKIAENPQSYRYAMVIKEDPYNPNNQFIRAEFYEALLRIALLKYRSLNSVDAFVKLMQNHILPNTNPVFKDNIRTRIISDDCQRIYEAYSPKLYKLFKHYAQQDTADVRPNASTTINLREYELMLHHYNLLSKLSRRIAMSSFALSQEDEIGNDQSSIYDMVYPEFLEVLARLADYRYGTPTQGNEVKGDTDDMKVSGGKVYNKLSDKLLALFSYMFPTDKRSQQLLLQQREEIIKAEEEAKLTAERESQSKKESETKAKSKKKKKPTSASTDK